MKYEAITSKVQFGEALKKYVLEKKNIGNIGNWIFSLESHGLGDDDKIFRELLYGLGMMAEGPEFEYTYEELLEIAEDLIACKEVVL